MRPVLLLVCLTACGDDSDPNGPRIVAIQFAGQLDSDPNTAIFLFSFDSPTTVSKGEVDMFLNNENSPHLTWQMAQLMLAGDVPLTAKRGEVAAVLRFGSEQLPQTKTTTIKLQIHDDDGKKSNRAEVTVRLTY